MKNAKNSLHVIKYLIEQLTGENYKNLSIDIFFKSVKTMTFFNYKCNLVKNIYYTFI